MRTKDEGAAREQKYDVNPLLIKRYREGDCEAGEELVILNEPLIYKIAAKFKDRGADEGDLIDCGRIGLVKAMRTFDPDRGYAFSTYAVPLIFGEIRRFLRDDGLIKVSREEKKLSAMLAKERERRQSSGLSCDIESIAASVGVSVQDAASAMFSEFPVRSLEESVYDDDGAVTLGSTVASEEGISSIDKLALKIAVESLSPIHKRIVILRYFKDYSQSEAAAVLGMTQVKVSREEKKIMSILHKQLSP